MTGLVALALAMNVWGLAQSGYGNTYYAAAVRSMTASWSNFFFGAFDPGGFITVDKPPAFLWAGAISARIFGYSTWSILMPSAIAGAASVGLLWLIVRKWFGLTAATIAGLALALSPISVAVNRLNMPEPFLVLSLLGAAGCVLQSIESRRWWVWTAAAGALVGVAFNTKMLGAWIPGPAFALALVVAVPALSRAHVKRAAGQLVVLLVVTLAVSGSWMAVVDAWPASARPYVGGSTNNTELDLALGYNGFGRVDGDGQGGPGRNAFPRFNGSQTPPGGPAGRGTFDGRGLPRGQAPNGGQFPGGRGIPGGQPPGGAAPAAGGRGAGGIIAGLPGLFRMLDNANGGQIGWLLPFAVGGGAIALWTWRRDQSRRAFAALFLGWVLMFGGVFSYAQGIFHSYYTAAMAPGVAALVGIGTVAMAEQVKRNTAWLAAVAGLVVLTVFTQLVIAERTPEFYGWVRPYLVIVALLGLGITAALAARRIPVTAGIAVAVAGLLLIPGAWSISEAANASQNTTLPQAGPREGGPSGASFGSEAFDDGTAGLAAWLEAHNDEAATWQLVMPSAQSASRLIAEYDISVMALGGFSGNDKTITVDGFAGLVESGEVRYVDVASRGPGGGPGGAGNPVLSAVRSSCAPVNDNTLPAQYRGSIYDCAGHASALAAAP